MVNVSIHDLLDLVKLATSMGVQDYLSGVDPDRDKVKLAEAKRFLKAHGCKQDMLRRWTELGFLHPVKTGESRNCSRLYSLSEIRKVMTAVKMKEMCNK